MALIRPAQAQEITAEDFGQPVYDGIIRQGFFRTGSPAENVAPVTATALSLAIAPHAVGTAFTTTDNRQFKCTIDGVYSCVGIVSANGAGPFPQQTFVAIAVNGLVRSRFTAINGNTDVFATVQVACLTALAVNDTISLVFYHAGGGTYAPRVVAFPGTANDPPAPSLSVWRVSL